LSRNRFAPSLARINPSMLEIDPPVTRLMMFSIVCALLKYAEPPVGIENCSKLWNRLLPTGVPPVISQLVQLGGTIELLGNVVSGTICATVGLEANR